MNSEFSGGLKKLSHDKRDYHFGAIFGKPDISVLPKSYLVGDSEIGDQGNTDECGAFSEAAVCGIQDGKTYDPHYTFWKIKKIDGDPTGFGADMRSIAEAAKIGLLEKKKSPFKNEPATTELRNKVILDASWPAGIDDQAKPNARPAYFFIEAYGGADMFDTIRDAMWKNKNEKRAVQAGTEWQDTWFGPEITKDGNALSGHAVALKGWDENWMLLQNSQGNRIGDKGNQKVSREMINKWFGPQYGVIMYAKPPEALTHQDIIQKSQVARAGKIKKVFLTILHLLQMLFNHDYGYI